MALGVFWASPRLLSFCFITAYRVKFEHFVCLVSGRWMHLIGTETHVRYIFYFLLGIEGFFRPKKANFKERKCVYKVWHEDWQDISLIDRMALSPPTHTPLWYTVHVSGNDCHRCHSGYHDNEHRVCARNLKNWHPTKEVSVCIYIPATGAWANLL